MRINKYVALATGLSRRKADQFIAKGRVEIDGSTANAGSLVSLKSKVLLDGRALHLPSEQITIMLNKPVGYVCSRNGQGSPTIYDLLPADYKNLKPVGRLDKDSSGLLLLTNDGQLANELTHPRFAKEKIYEIELAKPLKPNDKAKIEQGIELEDGPSKLRLSGKDKNWTVKMSEGRNRQIRRTFETLGYNIIRLHRTNIGTYSLSNLPPLKFKFI